MDFSLNSSVVLAAIVALWLVWVAPYLLRSRKPVSPVVPAQAVSLFLPVTAGDERPQGSIMDMSSSTSAPSATGSTAIPKTPAVTHRPVAGLKLRYDRVVLALLGVIALLTAAVTGILAAFSLVPGILPLLALGVVVLAVVALRGLAVRDRRKRVDTAFNEAMSAQPVERLVRPLGHVQPERRAETILFDAQQAGGPSSRNRSTGNGGTGNGGTEYRAANASGSNNDDAEPVTVRLTPAQLRAAALAVAGESGNAADSNNTKPGDAAPESLPDGQTESGRTESANAVGPAGAAAAGVPWQPVAVPKPTYVQAAKAERPSPAPLELPDAPMPQSKIPLKQPAAAPTMEAPDAASPSTGKMNLDDVLQRRRA